tara:strand:- start:230 stop:418 length:189 start_codon:yes stop_codon:yes gene_type:complete
MKYFILALLIVASAAPVEAGIFSRLFNRGCANGQCGVAAKPKAAAKYKYECKNGVCRRVEIK